MMNMEFKQYRRGGLIWIAIALLTVYLPIGYYHFLNDLMQVGQFLQSSGYIGMASALFGLFFGILISRREQEAGMAECLASAPGSALRNLSKLLAWGAICFILMAIASIEVMLMIWFSGSEYLSFAYKVILYIFLYWGMTLFSCGVLGFAIGELLGQSWWKLPLVLLVWFAISPFNMLFSRYIPVNVLSWLNQGEQDLGSAYNGVEGLYLAYSFIAKKTAFLAVCLTLAFASVLIRQEREPSLKEKRTLAAAVAGCLIIFVIFVAEAKSPLSAYKAPLNNYMDLYLSQDGEYYSANGSSKTEMSPPAFEVDRYDLDIKHTLNLINYNAQMRVSHVAPSLTSLRFTLYHNLEVKQAEVDGKPARWKRDGDWLYVDWPEGKVEGDVSFHIKGSAGANNPISETSFFMSSAFPWYPVPGTWIVAEKFDLFYEPQYNHIALSKPASFHISIHANERTYSNLPKQADGTFAGQSSGATVLSGMLMDKNVGGYQIVGPPDRIDEVGSAIEKVEQTKNHLSSLLGIKAPDMPKQIMVVPSFSFFPNYYMQLGEDELFVNELITRNPYTVENIARMESVFQAFFWSNRYRINDEQNSYIFRMILEYMESPNKKGTTLSHQVREIERQGDRAPATAYLARDILQFYNNQGEKGLKRLVRAAYQLSDARTLDFSDWKKLMDRSY